MFFVRMLCVCFFFLFLLACLLEEGEVVGPFRRKRFYITIKGNHIDFFSITQDTTMSSTTDGFTYNAYNINSFSINLHSYLLIPSHTHTIHHTHSPYTLTSYTIHSTLYTNTLYYTPYTTIQVYTPPTHLKSKLCCCLGRNSTFPLFDGCTLTSYVVINGIAISEDEFDGLRVERVAVLHEIFDAMFDVCLPASVGNIAHQKNNMRSKVYRCGLAPIITLFISTIS